MSQIITLKTDAQSISLISLLLDETDSSRMPLVGANQTSIVAPAPIKLNAVYARVREFNLGMKLLFEKAIEIERTLVGCPVSKAPEQTDLLDVARSAYAHLISKAEKEFSHSFAPLKIDSNEIDDDLGIADYARAWWLKTREDDHDQNLIREIPLDLDNIWNHLQTKYGNGKGTEVSLQQAAKEIVDQFRLKSEDKIIRQKSGVVLKRSIYAKKKDYGHNIGEYEYDWNHRERTVKLFKALASFASWANLATLAEEIHDLICSKLDNSFTYKPRMVIELDFIKLTFLASTWDFKLTPECAHKLMLFLAEFSTHE